MKKIENQEESGGEKSPSWVRSAMGYLHTASAGLMWLDGSWSTLAQSFHVNPQMKPDMPEGSQRAGHGDNIILDLLQKQDHSSAAENAHFNALFKSEL